MRVPSRKVVLILFAVFLPSWPECIAANLQLQSEPREHRLVQVSSNKSGQWLVLGPNHVAVKPETGSTAGPLQVNLADSVPINDGHAVLFVGPPGQYAVVQCVPDEPEPNILVVEIQSAVPGPTPDVPNPPGPAPIPVAGFRVLIVEERQDRGTLPRGQQLALDSADVMAYLNRKCVIGPDGKTPEWRKFDDDVDLSRESATWQQAFRLPRTSLPWIVISDGAKGISCPLPKTTADLLALLKQYGGE